MQLESSVLFKYQKNILTGDYQPDLMQHKVILKLNDLQQILLNSCKQKEHTKNRIYSNLFSKIFCQKKSSGHTNNKGLYIWGGVGRGKTWLMDLFFNSILMKRKLRYHLHRFLSRIHRELAIFQNKSNPLILVADHIKDEVDVICFDEFYVSNITDAMLLGQLLNELLLRNIMLVITSNFHPNDLYKNGLQRDRFLSTIDQIKLNCDIINMGADVDYRLRPLELANLWHYPLNENTKKNMYNMFSIFSGGSYIQEKILQINHRALKTLGFRERVLALDFGVICGEGRSQLDYIEIARYFNTVFLFNLPSIICILEDHMSRFLMLVDEFYDHHVKLIISSETELSSFYEDQHNIEYQRCFSRLQEMQSKKYLDLAHLT